MASPPHPSSTTPAASTPPSVTELLLAYGAGEERALDALVPLVYEELHRQAERALRHEASEHTLQATALVHEAYFRLVDQHRAGWKNRAHFFGVAAQLMRRILIDHARKRLAEKRGGGGVQVTLGQADAQGAADDSALGVLELDEALQRLAEHDAELVRLVELRYFTGLTIEDTAAVLGVSPATVKREWALARAFLRRELGGA